MCAPSNAAIDEIASRVRDGFQLLQPNSKISKVVRIGTDSAIGFGVKDISLDYLVDQKLPPGDNSADNGNQIASLRRELQDVKQQQAQKVQELDNISDNYARTQALGEEIRRLKSRRAALTQEVDKMRDKQKSDARGRDADRRKAKLDVLRDADVICTTLSGAGHDTLEQYDFDMVIIDEAAQAIELSTLIPLRHQCQRCIMVGDPQQLPPTVLSMEV